MMIMAAIVTYAGKLKVILVFLKKGGIIPELVL